MYMFLPLSRPKPPKGWEQKVNNALIGRVVIPEVQPPGNCATGSGAHIKCEGEGHGCIVDVSFLDETSERWAKPCEGGYLLFDDGRFTYFYGVKQPD